ncbi:MAG TPA: hypothetical protein VE961_18470 [Pyrinomonadaceae bacterium]|nr:hypothetical protein [Pyrinomonadaceae bacterium]
MNSGCRKILLIALGLGLSFICAAQARKYPDKIRGYKVERTVVEVKRPAAKTSATPAPNGQTAPDDSTVDQLISLGTPELARVTPLGITFEVPVVVAPVTQSGKVDFLVFEDMEINGRPVDISEYEHSFQLPNNKPSTLKNPLRISIHLPSALLAAIGEWTESKDTWPVTGRIYVFGKFKKGPFSFKRCVPVELNLTMRNPLKEK